MIVTNAAGDKTVFSSKAEWPEELPADVPRPEGIAVTASMNSESTGGVTVSVETERPFDEVVGIYRDYADQAGYAQTLEMKEDGYYMFTGTRGTETFTFTIQLDQEGGKTVTGAISYGSK